MALKIEISYSKLALLVALLSVVAFLLLGGDMARSFTRGSYDVLTWEPYMGGKGHPSRLFPSVVLLSLAVGALYSRLSWRLFACAILTALSVMASSDPKPLFGVAVCFLIVCTFAEGASLIRYARFSEKNAVAALRMFAICQLVAILVTPTLYTRSDGGYGGAVYGMFALVTVLPAVILVPLLVLWPSFDALPRWLQSPSRLPRRPRRGMTLIELLICIAILAIMLGGVGVSLRVSALNGGKALEARAAVLHAREAFDRCRSGSVPLTPQVRSLQVEANDLPSTLTISSPRADGLIPVRAEFLIGAGPAGQVITFNTLVLPEPQS